MVTNIRLLVSLQKLNAILNEKLNKNMHQYNLNMTEFIILAHLNLKNAEQIQKLGDIAYITSGTITYTINKLIKKGYIIKKQDLRDKRIFLVSLTKQGKKVYKNVFEKYIMYLNNILDGFTEETKQEFIEQIQYFNKHINNGGSSS